MYLVEMIEILPAVFILTGLINTWIPSKMIIKNFGNNSGFRGKFISMIIGLSQPVQFMLLSSCSIFTRKGC